MSKRILSHRPRALSDEIDERLNVKNYEKPHQHAAQRTPDMVDCLHCGQPFLPYTSTGGEFGMCQSCID